MANETCKFEYLVVPRELPQYNVYLYGKTFGIVSGAAPDRY